MTSVNINVFSLVLMGVINGLSFALGIFLYEFLLKKFILRGKDKVNYTFRSLKNRLLNREDEFDGKR